MRNVVLLTVGAPLAIGVWSFALKRPIVMLALYAGTIPFASLIGIPFGLPPPFNTLSTTLGLAAAFVVALHVALQSPRRGTLDPVARVWLVFLLLSALSIFWSVNPSGSQQQVLILASLVGLYVASSLLRVSWGQLDTIERAIITGGALTGAYGFFLLVTNNLHQTVAGAFRFETAGGGGDGADPNITAAALLLPLALSIAYYFRQDAFGHRLRYLVSTALISGGIVLTGSRGGMLSIVVVVGITFANDRKRLPHLSLVVILLAVIVILVPGDITSRLSGNSSTGRTEIWRAAVSACPDYCLTGAGYGTFSDVFESVWLSDPSVAVSNPRIGAHNVWLGVGIEVGVAGLFLLLVGLGLTAGRLSHVPADRRGPPLAALVGVVFANTFIANLDFKYFWLALTYALFVLLAHEDSLEVARIHARRTGQGQLALRAVPTENEQTIETVPSLLDVNGIGYVTSIQLNLHGIKTVAQLASTPVGTLVKIPGFAERRARKVKRSAVLQMINYEQIRASESARVDPDQGPLPGPHSEETREARVSYQPRRALHRRSTRHAVRMANQHSEKPDLD